MPLGELVYSKCGRDKGRPFIIVDMDEEGFVYLADGKLRRIEKAKKKKQKHIVKTGYVDKVIEDKLNKGERVTNSNIRKSIATYLENQSLKEV